MHVLVAVLAQHILDLAGLEVGVIIKHVVSDRRRGAMQRSVGVEGEIELFKSRNIVLDQNSGTASSLPSDPGLPFCGKAGMC